MVLRWAIEQNACTASVPCRAPRRGNVVTQRHDTSSCPASDHGRRGAFSSVIASRCMRRSSLLHSHFVTTARNLVMQWIIVFLAVVGAFLTGCSQSTSSRHEPQAAYSVSREDSIERLVAIVRRDPSKKPLLARAVMSADVLVIPDPGAKSLALVSFNQPERSFIPVFSSRGIFDEEAYGTGFEGKAIAIDANRFASLLENDDLVILNPGHRPAIEFKASDLKALAQARNRN